MRTVLVVLAGIGLAASRASADEFYTCYKTRTLKQPQFAGSTPDRVADELRVDSDDATKKEFLYCTTTPRGDRWTLPPIKLSCYKVKGTEAEGSNRSTDDAGDAAEQSPPRKTYVLCVPAAS